MKKSITKNYIYNMLYQILVIIIPIITTPYLTRTLGPDGVGASAYVISIITYFVLFGSLGASLYGKREIAYVQDNKRKRSRIFIEILLLKSFSILITIGIYYLFIQTTNDYSHYFKVLIFELIANIFDISWFYHGIENFKSTAIRNSIIKISSLICIFIFVKSPNDTDIYLLIYGLSTLIGNLSLWANIKKYIAFRAVKIKDVLGHFKSIIKLFIPQVANRLYAVIDKTMLGILIVNISEVGFYDQSEKIVKIWITMITALGIVVMPRIANYYANKNHDRIEALMRKTIRYVYFCSFPMILGLIAVSNNLVPIYLGDGFEKSISIIKILSPIILIIGLNNIIGNQYLLPTKQQKQYTMAVVSGCIINFSLNLLLIPPLGSYGACISTIISEMSVLLIEIFHIRKQFNCKKLFSNFKNYLIASIIMFLIIIPLGTITSNRLLNGTIQVIAGCILYVTILFATKDAMILTIAKTIRKKIAK